MPMDTLGVLGSRMAGMEGTAKADGLESALSSLEELLSKTAKQVKEISESNSAYSSDVDDVKNRLKEIDSYSSSSGESIDMMGRKLKQLQNLTDEHNMAIQTLRSKVALNSRRQSEAANLKIQSLEGDIAKVYKFQLLMIFAVGLIAFWAVWWNYQVNHLMGKSGGAYSHRHTRV